jgi:hypothetical protein
MILDSWHWF